MLWLPIFILALVFMVYCVIPNYWARNHSKRVLRRGDPLSPKIALTFDDGPHPQYTPALLDILKAHQVHASFFLVGHRAALNPQIVKRIKEEGHSIGCHSFFHQHAWLMHPVKTYVDMKKTCQVIKSITGSPPRWFRPPWGTFNLFTMHSAARLGLSPVYWSVEAHDWEAKTRVEDIEQSVVRQARPGSIIVLHDNGGAPSAPEKTLKALPFIITTLKKRGYIFSTIDRMKGEQV